jgi:hypothetical protein
MSEDPSTEKESKYHSWWTVPFKADRQLLSIGMRGSKLMFTGPWTVTSIRETEVVQPL